MPANHPSVSRSLSDQSAPDASSQVPGAAAWKPWKVVIAFVAVVGLALAGRATVASSGEGPLLGIAIALMLLSVAPVGLALLLANVDATPTARDFGLVRPRFVRALALMFAVLIGLMAMFVLWSAALGLDEDAGTPLAERLGTEGTLNVLILVVVLTVLGPLGEEFLFRGYIFRALRNWRGLWPAAITAGVVFTATHSGWLPLASAVPVTLFGIGMCLLYHWTGSLYPCIAVHAIMNSIALGGVLHWTWQLPLLIAGSTLAALAICRLIAHRLDDTHLRRHSRRVGAQPGRAS